MSQPQPQQDPYELAEKVSKYVNTHIVHNPGEKWFQHYANYCQSAFQSCSHIIVQSLSSSLSNTRHTPEHTKQVLYFIDYLLRAQPKYRDLFKPTLFPAMIQQYEHLLAQRLEKCGPVDTGEVSELEKISNKVDIVVNLWAEQSIFAINDTMTLQQQLQLLLTQYEEKIDAKMQSLAFLHQPTDSNINAIPSDDYHDLSQPMHQLMDGDVHGNSPMRNAQDQLESLLENAQNDRHIGLNADKKRQRPAPTPNQPYSNLNDEVMLATADQSDQSNPTQANKLNAQQSSLFRGGFGDIFFHQREPVPSSSRDHPNASNKRIIMEYHRQLAAGQHAASTIDDRATVANFSQIALLSFRPNAFETVAKIDNMMNPRNTFICRVCGLACKDEQVYRSHVSFHSAKTKHLNRQSDQLVTISQSAHPHAMITPLHLSHYDTSIAIITSMDDDVDLTPLRNFNEDRNTMLASLPPHRQTLFQQDDLANYITKSRAWYVTATNWTGIHANVGFVPHSFRTTPDAHNFHPMIDCPENDTYRVELKEHDQKIKAEIVEKEKMLKEELNQYIGPTLPTVGITQQFKTELVPDGLPSVKVEVIDGKVVEEAKIGSDGVEIKAEDDRVNAEGERVGERSAHNESQQEAPKVEEIEHEEEEGDEWDDDDYHIDFGTGK